MSDCATPKLTKRPGESRAYSMEFAALLGTGVTLTSFSGAAQSNAGNISGASDLTIGSGTVSGTEAQATISGGTDGEDYTVTFTVVDSAGNTLVDNGLLRVRA